MVTTFGMKLQSPLYDNAGAGYELPLPVTQDSYTGDSMAALIALFDAKNKVMDFRQYSEKVSLVGVFTQPAATDATYANPIQMRDEARRIRAATAAFGKNTTATVKSWLTETPGGGTNWGTASLPADERDAGTTRKAGTIRLIYDQYWDPTGTPQYRKFFMYGTVTNVQFGPRPAASTLTRIPFVINFLVGEVKLGS